MISHHRYRALLAALFAVLWIALAITPLHRADWALENVPVLLGSIALSWRRAGVLHADLPVPLPAWDRRALHVLGSPLRRVVRQADRSSFNDLMGWQRNQFDRLAHFLYGLLLAYPLREIYLRVADARGFWGYFLPLDVTVASSAMYEMVEWLAAVMFGGELGIAYLGTQGDVWGAQRDMLMAGHDFARECQESLHVKIHAPPGEDEVERMLRDPPDGGA